MASSSATSDRPHRRCGRHLLGGTARVIRRRRDQYPGERCIDSRDLRPRLPPNRAASVSASISGKRVASLWNTILASSMASCLPRQKCGPNPNEICRPAFTRRRSSSPGLSKTLGSRFAPPMIGSTVSPLPISRPSMRIGSSATRATTTEQGSRTSGARRCRCRGATAPHRVPATDPAAGAFPADRCRGGWSLSRARRAAAARRTPRARPRRAGHRRLRPSALRRVRLRFRPTRGEDQIADIRTELRHRRGVSASMSGVLVPRHRPSLLDHSRISPRSA